MKSPSLGLSAPWCAALSAHRPFSFLHIGLQIGDFIHFSSCHPGGGSGIFLFILENKSAFGKKKNKRCGKLADSPGFSLAPFLEHSASSQWASVWSACREPGRGTIGAGGGVDGSRKVCQILL